MIICFVDIGGIVDHPSLFKPSFRRITNDIGYIKNL